MAQENTPPEASDERKQRLVEEICSLTEEERRSVSVQAQARIEAREADEDEDAVRTVLAKDWLATEVSRPPSLLSPAGLVVTGGVHMTIARSGKGKTVWNVNRLIRWAAGQPAFPDAPVPLTPERPLKSMIVENEGSAYMLQQQVKRMIEHSGFSPAERKAFGENFIIYGDGGYAGVHLDDKKRRAQLLTEIDRRRPDVLFIEPFRMLWRGEENSATEMDKVLKDMLQFADDYKLAIMSAHHAKKGMAEDGDLMSLSRGSTALEGALTLMEHMTHISEHDQVEVEWTKVRYQEEAFPKTFRMKWNVDTFWFEYVADSELGLKIINLLEVAQGRQLSLPSIVEMSGEKYHTVRRQCVKLSEEGKITAFSHQGASWYRISGDQEEGLDY